MNNIIQMIDEAASYIKDHIDFTPQIAIILGSGLGPLAGEIKSPVVMKYSDIPHFKASAVAGHAGELIAGTIDGRKVLVMNGRFHYYEGHPMEIVTLPIRVFARLGIRNLLVTNAAGGIADRLNPGSIMLITDHLSMMCPSPLIGANLDEFGPRFPDMTDVYTPKLLDIARHAASVSGVSVEEGVYCYFRGPQYETPAEIRAVRALGADAAGMSTVPEAIVARHCGMQILGISLITNKAAGLGSGGLSHTEVNETANSSEERIIRLVHQILDEWN
ncbi:MAG: purine-nucleoside phosphorylase [Lachnospiraceae bacterium]|nr:purine-nucleoside phosphorylase [Lachnospiraceae bacterium]